MGIYDRDYYRAPTSGPRLGNLQHWSINTWLIAINVAVFFIDAILSRLTGDFVLHEWGYFSVLTAISHLQVWRVITFQFLHSTSSISHILWNMVSLYYFGRVIETYLGSSRYLLFYLLCGIGGALGYIILNYAGMLHYGPDTPLIGASAGIFGVLIAAATVAPAMPVMVFPLPFMIQLRTLAWIFLGIAAYTILISGDNAGGQAAHLGGALVGYLLIRNQRLLDLLHFRRSGMFFRGKRVIFQDWRNNKNR